MSFSLDVWIIVVTGLPRIRPIKHRAFRKADRCDKVVAASGYRNDIAPACVRFAQGPAQRADLSLEVAVIDEDLRPDPGNQLVFADHLAGLFHQSGQDVEGTAADLNLSVPLQQQPLTGKQSERAEGKYAPAGRNGAT